MAFLCRTYSNVQYELVQSLQYLLSAEYFSCRCFEYLSFELSQEAFKRQIHAQFQSKKWLLKKHTNIFDGKHRGSEQPLISQLLRMNSLFSIDSFLSFDPFLLSSVLLRAIHEIDRLICRLIDSRIDSSIVWWFGDWFVLVDSKSGYGQKGVAFL